MGGGDLNLKKSWHVSTFANIEKVWKREQAKKVEDRKIAELQKEIAEQRKQEQLEAHAIANGAVKKKEERVEFMYAGGVDTVNRDEYLLGRKIDKNINIGGKDDLKIDGPGATFQVASSANDPRDTARKVRDDPMFAIMKKKQEGVQAIMNNPLRMKQIQERLKSQKDKKKHKKDKKSKKDKNRDSRRRSVSPDVRGGGGERDSLARDDKPNRGRRPRYPDSASPPRRRSRSPIRRRSRSRSPPRRRSRSRSPYRKYDRPGPLVGKRRRSRSPPRNGTAHSRSRSPPRRRSRSRSPYRKYDRPGPHVGKRRRSRSPPRNGTAQSPPLSKSQSKSNGVSKESDEEIRQRKLKEMMDNVEWQKKSREEQSKIYKQREAEQARRDNMSKATGVTGGAKFLDKMHKDSFASSATSSVEDRINRNRHYIQRTKADLDGGNAFRR